MHHFRGWKHERLRNLLDSRLSTMTPEEREKFAAEWGCHRSNPPKTDAKVVS
jgi:glutamyl/glutaminyl-tRNA synthetase